MKSLVCLEPGKLVLEERSPPPAPGPGMVRLKIDQVGICGTDYHIFAGRQPFLAYPRVMGHEIAAKVAESGQGVDLEIGTQVIVNPYLACGRCFACLHSRPNCCMNIKVLGVHTDGAFCEEITIPAANAYPAGDMTPEAVASVEFLAIGAHAVRRSMAGRDTSTLVIGAGPIGLAAALFARIAGHEVTLMDTSASRLAIASQQFGFSSLIDATADPIAAVAEMTGQNGFAAVFDATGNQGSMQQALNHVAHGGVLVFVGLVKDDISFSDPEFHKREMMIIASRNALKVDFDHVASSIRNGAVDVSRLVTHRISLDEAVDELPRLAGNREGLIKAMIKVGP